MRKKIFTFLLALAASVGLSWAAPAVAVNGKLPGAFSVGESTVVYFSQGNLQYTKSTGKWKIMDHQYDVVETPSQNVGTDYASQDVITLFGWGTSGWDNTAADATSVHYQPYSTCKTIHNSNANINNYQYGPSNANVVGSSKAASAESWSKSDSYKNYDWGVFNSGDLGSGWRVLTTQEWGYLLGSTSPARTNAANLRTLATVNSVPGLIIMPDGWTASGVSLTVTTSKYTTNNINLTNWSTLEEQGCVFLPAAGYREGTSVMDNVGTRGFYWSSSAYSANYAYVLRFYTYSMGPQEINGRYDGCSVRLVSETAPSPAPANSCGDGLTWELNGGVLTISYDGVGTGEMYDFGYESDQNPVNVAPWKEYKSEITTVIVGDGVKSIGNHAFNDLIENFTAVTIANSVERIGLNAFLNAEEITEITLPSSLKTIDEQGFANCGFTSITIPSGVTSIGYKAFCYCRDLTSLTCEATTPPALASSVFYKIRSSTSSLSSIPLHVPSGSVADYQAASQWNAFDIQGYDPAPTPSGLQVTELQVPGSWQDNPTMLSTSDMPGFVAITEAEAAAWDAAPAGEVALIFAFEGDGATSLSFKNGVYQAAQAHNITYEDLYAWYSEGEKIFYTGGGSTPTPTPAESVTVVFEANNNQKEVEVTLPHTFACDFQNGQGELDGIIQELYALQYGGYCQAFNVPTATGNEAVTASKDGNNHYIAISEAFEGTATVTGNYIKYLDTEHMGNTSVDYTLTISVQGSTPTVDPEPATGLQVVEVTSELYDGWNSNSNPFSVNALPGFQAVTFDEAKEWTGVPTSGTAALVYRTNGDYARVIHFFDGDITGDYDLETSFNQMYENITIFGNRIFYTAGGGSTPAVDPTPTPSATGGIFANCYDCWRNPEYPNISGQCYLHSFDNPRVGNNTPSGPWKLVFVENYNSSSTEYDSDIVKSDVAGEYGKSPEQMEVYRLYQWQNGAYQPVAYGVLYAYANENNQVEHAAFFEASGFWGCYLTDNTHSSGDNINILFNEDASTGFADLHGEPTPAVDPTPTPTPSGDGDKLAGAFSVGGDKVVYFSKANLQATTADNGSTWTWGFAENQWDYVGNSAANNAINGGGTVSTNGPVDLFAWSSTDNNYFGINNSINEVDYSGDFKDWGAKKGSDWRTLTINEWQYLLQERNPGSSSANHTNYPRYTNAQILTDGTAPQKDIKGIILFPDDFNDGGESIDGVTWGSINPSFYSSYPTTCTTAGWATLESMGCVFLPSAGSRQNFGDEFAILDVNQMGNYWSSTLSSGEPEDPQSIAVGNGTLGIGTNPRYFGMSVRLVSETAPSPAPANPEIKLYADFSGDWADTEAFTDNGDGTATLTIPSLEAKHNAIFVKKDGVEMSSGHNFTRENPSANVSGNQLAMWFDTDEAGEYTFTFEYSTNILTITYPTATPTPTPSDDANKLPGAFSVSGTKVVYFSKGNLQATTADNGNTWTWGFAEKQYDVIGDAVANKAINGGGTVSSNGAVDLFGWSSNANNYYGIDNSMSVDDYSGNFQDWGAKMGSDWHALNGAQWEYLLLTREPGSLAGGTSNPRFTRATILTDGTAPSQDIFGLILFPDNFNDGGEYIDGVTWNGINSHSSYVSPTTCTTAGWATLESMGCVFLPAPGWRSGNEVTNAGAFGIYWSSTKYSEEDASCIYFSNTDVAAFHSYITTGASVRLVSETAPSPAPDPTPSETTVTWDLSDMESMGTQGGYFKAKGITLMAYGVENGIGGSGSYEGAYFCGPFVFTTSLGKFTKIEVTNSHLYEQPAFSGDGWTLDGTNAVWEGTPAALVSLVSNFGGITQIKFTIDPNTSTPANSCGDGLTWAVNDGVLTISYDGVGTGSMDNYDDPLSMPWYGQNITSVVLPEGLISIGQNAFAFINTFSQITLPSTLQYILMNAFSGCGLTSVTIPENVKGIGASAFISSQSLATVTFEPTTPPRVGGNAFEYCHNDLIIHYPCESRAQYYKDMQADIAYYHDKMYNCPAPPSNLHVTELEPPASWSGKSTYLTVADMPGFEETDAELAKTWEAPTNCNSILIYHVTEQYGEERMYYHYFYSGNFEESEDGWYPLGTVYSNATNNGIKTFYTSSGGGSTPANPEIKLNANFGGTYDWADTEAFTDNGDGTATLSNIALTAGYYYNFNVNVGDVWFHNNYEFTRQNPSYVINSSGEGVYYFQADVTGNYSFTWEYATNTLTIGYPEIHTYTAVGQNLAVFGNSWDPSITDNDLVLQEDGSYKWEKNVSFTGAITIQYRVCEDHAWGVAYPATSEDAATFEIPSLGDYKITITYNPVGNVISASAEKIAKPTIQLNGNFSGEWADTEAFEVVEQPMDSYAKLTKLLEPGTYEFGVKVNGELRANGSAYTRDNYSYIIAEGHTGNLTINVDVKGYYSFFWYYDNNRLIIDYSRVCGMYWKDVTAGNFEVTLGQEGEVTLPKVWATSMAFVANIANGADQVRLGSTDETVATIAYTLSPDGLGTLTFHQAGECDIYVVHDITDYYCYDSCAFHLTVHPAAPVGPTYLDADFAIDFMSDPYTVVGGGALPTGVEVEGSMNTGDSQHGYRLPVITIPVTAGNYKVMMGTCSYSNQDATVKTEDGSHTYATLATNNGTCYHNNTTANVVGAIFNVPSDQIIKVYGAEYTPFFSIEKMAAVPAFTDFEINFQSDPYIVISGAKPEGTVIIGTYHDNLHGYQNVEAVVPVEAGNYRLTVGACQYGTPGNVMSETNAELASFNSNLGEGNCYHNNTAANIVSTIFTVDMDQTITINGGAYMPYMKLEKLLDNTYYINFENAEGAIGTVPGEIAIAAGESWTIPANLTLYKEGYTFVGWSDGVNTYAPGDEFFPNAHGTLQAVYTANSVSIADASTINVKWYFGESNGAPSVTWNGVAGYLLAKGEVDGQMIDLKLDIDATSGKFHNAGRGDKWAQVNANTVFTFPSKEGAVVNVETYSGNATYDLAAGTLTCNTNDYYSYLEVVYPAPTTAVVIGDPNDADQVTAFLNTYEGQTVPDLTIDRPVLNNMYNTLCLPFHMDADQIANSSLNGVEIYEFVDVDVTNDELYLYTSEQKHEIVAGRPYLVKFSAASQLDDLNFINVVINNANLDDQAVTIKGVTFKGTFQPVVLGAQEGLDFNGGHLFLMANNTLMWPNTDNPLKPFRAYFTVNVDAGQSAGMPVRRGMPAHIGGPAQIPTGVENVQGDNVQSTKVVENGVLYIIKNGVKYNAQGQVVK